MKIKAWVVAGMMLYGGVLSAEYPVNDDVKQIDKEEDDLLDSLANEKSPEATKKPAAPDNEISVPEISTPQIIVPPTPTPQIKTEPKPEPIAEVVVETPPKTTPNKEKSIEEKIAIVDAQIKEQEKRVQEAKAKKELEERAKKAAEAKAREAAEAKAREEAKVKQEQELRAKQDAQLKAQKEAQLKAQKDEELKAQKEAELKAKKEAEAIETAKREDEARVAAKAKKEAELKAKSEPKKGNGWFNPFGGSDESKKLTKAEAIVKAKAIAGEQIKNGELSQELQDILPMVLDAISIDEMDGLDIDEKRAVITLKKKLEKQRAQVEAKKLFDQALSDAIKSVR